MTSNKRLWLFMLVVILLPSVVFAMVKWYEYGHTRLPVLNTAGQEISDFQLSDQNGKTVSLSDWNGKIVIAHLFFSHCPVVCPRLLRSLKQVQQTYPADSSLAYYSFSVDPERDSIERLRSYAAIVNITGNWHLLTGDKRSIYRIARKSLKLVATDGDGGPADFIHSELLVLIDPHKKIRGYYRGTDQTEVRDLERDIKRLTREIRSGD